MTARTHSRNGGDVILCFIVWNKNLSLQVAYSNKIEVAIVIYFKDDPVAVDTTYTKCQMNDNSILWFILCN